MFFNFQNEDKAHSFSILNSFAIAFAFLHAGKRFILFSSKNVLLSAILITALLLKKEHYYA